MPSPMETLLRTQLSPVPTQTILGLRGSMATAPMDCTSGLSNTGLKVVPPLTDFQTPPLAEAAKTVSRPLSLTAVTAAMRPLICRRADVARGQAGDGAGVVPDGRLRRRAGAATKQRTAEG